MYCTFVPFMQNNGARSLVKLGQRLKVLMFIFINVIVSNLPDQKINKTKNKKKKVDNS